MEDWPLMLSMPLAALAKVLAWLGLFLLTADRCPEAIAVALEPPLLKCFPPAQQALILANIGTVVLAGIMLLS
ncbi:MAG TPA: hypothetical protein VNT02_01080 [Burkholderiales bacterium]|nr:hypothetical protein [Burkholderiales bacterium]